MHARWQVSLPIGKNIYCGRAFAIMKDGNGKAEIFVSNDNKIVIFNQAGRRLDSWKIGRSLEFLAAGITPHGPLVIGFDTWDDRITAFRNGRKIWSYYNDSAVDWACPVDIHSPRGDAVAIGYNGDGGVRLLNADGKLLWHVHGPGNVWSVGTARMKPAEPASVICAHSEGTILVYNAAGKRVREINYGAHTDRPLDVGAVYGADLDGDGRDEILGLGTTQESGNYLWVFDAEGQLRWRRPLITEYAFLEAPIVVGHFWPSGRQVAVGNADGTVWIFDARGVPLSYLHVQPDLRALCVLPGGQGGRDALVALTSKGLVCYAWKHGKPSPIPHHLIVPKPEPPLILAVQNKDLSGVKALLYRGSGPNQESNDGEPALLIAARKGQSAIVQALLDRGADLKARSENGDTALLAAAEGGHREIVQMLLAKGADVNAANNKGITSGMTPLMAAVMYNHAALVRLLLDKGANIKARDENLQETALHLAAEHADGAIVKMLLDKGAEVDARNWLGMTPLMEAAANLEMIKLLVKSGANVNARDDKTRRVYVIAQFDGDKATQKQIEQSGRLKTLHEDGESVMDYARLGGNKEIIQWLKKAGAKE